MNKRTMKPMQRTCTFDRSGIDTEKRTIELSVSSDADTVTRWIHPYGTVREILGHAKKEINLSRFSAETGAPLLYNHDFSELIGRFAATEIKGGKLRGVARFGNSPRAVALWKDLRDGILCDVSITYDYDPRNAEVTERDENGQPLAVRITQWEPLEVSFVTVPADPTVGVGRALRAKKDKDEDDEERDEEEEEDRDEDEEDEEENEEEKDDGDRSEDDEDDDEDDEEDEEKDEDRSLTTNKKAPQPVPKRAKTAIRAAKEKRMPQTNAADDRITKILKIADGYNVSAEKRNEWLGQGASVAQVKNEILEGFRAASKPLPPPSDQLGLSQKERKGYSIAAALRSLVTNDPNVGGLEREVSSALAQKLGRHTGGMLIPTDMRMRHSRATHATNIPGMGGNLVMPEYMGYLDLLKNAAVVLQMGATLVTGLQGNPQWVRQTGTSQYYWMPENPGMDVTESNLAFNIVTSTPKTAKALLSYTRQQVLQSVESFEPLLQKDLLENDALVIDTAALNGSGNAYQPLGLLNTPGIHALNLGVNGGRPTYADITRLKTLVKKANALGLGEGGYLTTPDIQDLLENTPRLANQVALPIWENNSLAGYRALGANQVPSNLTKGAAQGSCHALIFGIWSELFILEWGALEMVVDPYTKAAQDVIRVTTSHLVDVFVRRPQAFAAIKDAQAQ